MDYSGVMVTLRALYVYRPKLDKLAGIYIYICMHTTYMHIYCHIGMSMKYTIAPAM
jgi:hypothetical protein